jgi:hypothetical protein
VATHVVPTTGLSTWHEPDPAAPPGDALAAGTEVDVVERRGDWAQVRCTNGFTAWVDGRVLVPVPAATSPPPVVAAPPGPPVLQRVAALDFSFSRPVIAAAFLAFAGFLPWARGGITSSGFDIPIAFLFNYKTTGRGGLSVGLVLLAAGIAAGAGVVLPDRDVWRRAAGFAGAAVAGLYVVQLQRVVSATGGGTSLFKIFGFGALVAAVAGLVLALDKRS